MMPIGRRDFLRSVSQGTLATSAGVSLVAGAAQQTARAAPAGGKAKIKIAQIGTAHAHAGVVGGHEPLGRVTNRLRLAG